MSFLHAKLISNDDVQKEFLTHNIILQDVHLQTKMYCIILMILTVIIFGVISICVFCVKPSLNTESLDSGTVLAMMILIPLLVWFLFAMILGRNCVHFRRIEKCIQKKSYCFDEDIITSKYTKMVRHDDHDTTYKRYLTGIKNGDAVPEVKNIIEWKQSKIGDKFWIMQVKDNDKVIYDVVYCSVFYDLSPELASYVEFLTERDIQNAKRVVKDAIDDGDFSVVPKSEFAFGFLDENKKITNSHNKTFDDRKIVVCISCGRRFNATKYKNICPKCGAMYVDNV